MKKFLLSILSIFAVTLSGFALQVNVTPAPGEVTEIPQTIKVSTDKDIFFVAMMNMGKITFTDADGVSYDPSHNCPLFGTATGTKEFDITLNQAYTKPGNYKLFIKANSLSNADQSDLCSALTFEWTIAEGGSTEPETPELDPNAVNFLGIDPAEGTVAEIPSSIFVTCDRDLYFSTSLSALNKVHMTDAAGNTYAIKTCVTKNMDGNGANGNETLEVRLTDGAITANGTYTLTFDEGAIKDYNVRANVNKAKSFTWTIGGSSTPAEPVVTISPADGETLDALSKVTVTCDQGIAFNKMKYSCVKGMTSTTQFASYNQVDENTIELLLGVDLTDGGEYTVQIDPGVFTLAPNGAAISYPESTFTSTVYVSGALAAKIEVSPAADTTHESLQHFVVSYPKGIAVHPYPMETAFLGNSATGEQIFLTQTNGNETSVTLSTPEEVTTAGYYTLYIPAQYLILENMNLNNEPIMCNYMVTGKEEPETPTAVNILNVTPAEGTVEELSSILVEVDQPIVFHPMADFSLVDQDGTYYLPTRELADPDGDGVNKHALLTFETPITAAGTYTFSMSANALANMEMQIGTPATTYTYTIEGGSTPEPEYVKVFRTEPAEGTVTEIPATIYIYTDTDLNGANKSLISLTDANGTSYTINSVGAGSSGEQGGIYDRLYIKINDYNAITAAGTYTLTIQANAMVEYGAGEKTNEALSYTWTVEPAAPEYMQIVKTVPEVGVVSEIPTTIGIYTDTDLVGASYSKMSLKDANGTEYQFVESGVADPQGDGFYECAYVMLAKAITAPGTYTLTVEEGAITQYNGPKVNEALSFTWTIEGGQDPQPSTDYVFDANEYPEGNLTLPHTDGIFTFCQGQGTDKVWSVEANDKTFANGHVATNRMKPNSDKNYITADIPAAGKLVFAVVAGGSGDRSLVVTQNDVELYNQLVVSDSEDAFPVHEVAVEAGLVTISMVKTLNFYFIEFVESSEPAGDFFDLVSVPEAGEVPLLPSKLYVYAGEEIVNADPYDLSKITLTDANGNNYVQSAGAVDYDGDTKYDGLYIRIASGNNNITTAGTYTLNIAEGLVTLKESGKVNKEATFTWTVTGEKPVIKFKEIDPAEGVVEEIPSTITITTDTDLDIPNTNLISLTDANGNSYAIAGSNWGDVYGTGFIFLAEAITAPGNYTLTVKAGALKDYWSDKVNDEWIFNWTIEGNDEPELDPDHINFLSVDPAEGTVAEIPAEIWVKTDTDLYIGTSNSAQNKFHLTDANGNTYAVTAVSKDNDGNYTYESVKVTLAAGAITAPGTYTLTFDEGALKDYNDRTFINLAKSFTWTIEDTSAELIQVLSVNPAEGVVEVLPRTIDIFTDTDLVAATVSQMTMTDASGNEYAVMEATPGDSDQNGSWDRLRISLAQEITTPGTYTLTIPAGAIQEMGGNRTNAELTFTWTVAAVEYIEVYSVDPEEGNLGQLPALISIYTNADIISVAESKVSLVDDKGNNHALKITTKDTDYNETVETVEFELVNGAIKTQGTYTLTIEKGAMVDYSDPNLTNNTLVFVWEVEGTGIAGIEAGADGYVVYDLNGYLVMQTRDAADLRQLERGFYIINGKKVVLNK